MEQYFRVRNLTNLNDFSLEELGALVQLQFDYKNKRKVTVSYYARKWKWDRKKVDRLFKKCCVEIKKSAKKPSGILEISEDWMRKDNSCPILDDRISRFTNRGH